MKTRSPRLAHALLFCALSPAYRDDILGDMEERFAAHGRAGRVSWFWRETLRSLPSFALMRWRETFGMLTAWDAALAGTLFLFAYEWETDVAQHFAWPLCQQVLAYSPLTVSATCMGSYIALHFLPYGLMGFALERMGQRFGLERRAMRKAYLCLVIAALAPALFFMVQPTPHDALSFRLIQLAVMGMGLFSMHRAARASWMLSRPRLSRHSRA